MRSEFVHVLLVLAMAVIGLASLVGQPAEITITGRRGVPVALRGFQGAEGGPVAALVAKELRRSGRVRLEPEPGAYAVSGTAQAGRLEGTVTGPDGRSVLERRYEGGDARTLARRFAADLLREVTGTPGIVGTRLAFAATGSGRKEIHVVEDDGGNLRQVTRDGSISVSPALAPGGTKLAYTGYLNGFADIYLVDLYTGQRQRLVGEPGTNTGAAFSPDGTRIACTMSHSGNPELHVVSVKGGQARALTRSRFVESSPSWSPDGKQLVFVSDATGVPQLYVMAADGGRPRRLETGHRHCLEPDWSPDGARIAFNVRDGGRHQVAIHDLRTGETRVLTSGASAEDPVWGADGRHLAYVQGQTIFLHDTEANTRSPVVSGLGDLSELSWSR
jgi:TolB protein